MFKRKLFWLIIIATALVTLNMTLLWKLDDIAHFWMSIVFWFAVGFPALGQPGYSQTE